MNRGSSPAEILEVDSVTIEDLVAANHILFDQKVVDGFGHVSIRHPTKTDYYLLSRSMAPALVGPTDIMLFDLQSNLLTGGNGHSPYLERFIHGEIYRKRPDVNAVVHSHSPAVVPFGVVPSVPLRPICHMCGFLAHSAPVFDIRNTAGNGTDLLIRNNALGNALAQALGESAAILMRGHGSTVVGHDLRQVVFRAVYTEVNARLQAEAMRMGDPIYLTDEEASAASATNDGQIGRAWDLWKLQAMSPK